MASAVWMIMHYVVGYPSQDYQAASRVLLSLLDRAARPNVERSNSLPKDLRNARHMHIDNRAISDEGSINL
jgi:hypothetical protein